MILLSNASAALSPKFDAPARSALTVQRLHGPFHYPIEERAMADDLKQTGKPDDQRINVEQDHELKAGPLVKNVRQHLNR